MRIEVKNVSKKFKKDYVLANANLVFEEGNIYGFIGRNGSGKSVLLKIICGIYKPTEGEILFDGKYCDFSNIYQQDIRALIEKPCFFSDLTGYENLKLLASIQNKITENDIIEALKIVNLLSEKDKKYSQYSLGMKQKLGIAQVIMEKPKIMILDEPFNGIEEKTVEKIIKYLSNIKNKDKIIIISSHIKSDLEKLTDKIFCFQGGHVK